MSSLPDLTFAGLQAAYASGVSVEQLAGKVLAAIAAAGDDKVWIARRADADIIADARRLDALRRAGSTLPLLGVPFAVKDNIDVAGLATTAACPAYSYVPAQSAPCVERLLAAGALLIGKTNLDQFATGLVGTRSPYGVARNPFDAAYIPGGSSSGSAVAVASGLVAFALGTDTAGSGRVPAMFNNIVGLKPSKGLIATKGVVPACRSLDCVSVFALTVEDAMAVLAVAAGEADDAFSRAAPAGYRALVQAAPASFTFAVPRADQLKFFGNAETERLWHEAVARLQALGGTKREIDYAPFLEAAQLLYAGPWVAERTAAIDRFLAEQPGALYPVTRTIIEGGRKFSAVDGFNGQYRLAALRRQTEAVWRDCDLMLLPTAGTIYRVAELEADPLQPNSNLGYYTNFMNLLDLCGIAVPGGFQANGLPSGITLVAPAFAEPRLAGLASAMHRAANVALGATGRAMPAPVAAREGNFPAIALAVFGAHMSGQPLNKDLLALGARPLGALATKACYRLYRVPGNRPGLIRVASGGVSVEGELWSLPLAGIGVLLDSIAPPLGLGTIELADGRTVKGFICEGSAADPAADISAHGGWLGYLANSR